MAHKLEERQKCIGVEIHNLTDGEVMVKCPEDLDCLLDDILDGEYEGCDCCDDEEKEGTLLRLCIEWISLHNCIWATHHHMEEYHAGEEKYAGHDHKRDGVMKKE